jgi:hypothetical protein
MFFSCALLQRIQGNHVFSSSTRAAVRSFNVRVGNLVVGQGLKELTKIGVNVKLQTD